jgi:hypothetical protein
VGDLARGPGKSRREGESGEHDRESLHEAATDACRGRAAGWRRTNADTAGDVPPAAVFTRRLTAPAFGGTFGSSNFREDRHGAVRDGEYSYRSVGG